jgi:hypothetical protein
MNGPGTSRTLAAFYATRDRRQRLSAEFRRELLAELAEKKLDATSASASAMIDLAVSARVQVSELSRQFADNRATPKAQTQLGLARGQLQRALRALKLVDRDEDDEPRGPNLAEWIEQRAREKSERETEALAVNAGAQP